MANLKNPITGTVVEVSDADAAAKREAGYTDVSAEEVRASALQKKHGGVAGQAVAAGAGWLRSMSAGHSDAILIEAADVLGMDPDSAKQTLKDLAEANPHSTTAGEFGGYVTPGGAAMKAGQLAMKGAKAAGAASKGWKAYAAMGAAEGAVTGYQGAITESTLGDMELTAEGLIAEMGYGALVGGGVGAAISKGGSLLRARRDSRLAAAMMKPTAEGTESLLAKGMGGGAATKDASSAWSRFWASAADTAGATGADDVAQLGAMNAASREMRHTAVNAKAIITEQATESASLISRMHRMMGDLGERFKGKAKYSELDRTMAHANAEAIAVRAGGEIQAFAGEMTEALAAKGAYGKRGALQKALQRAKHVEKEIAANASNPTKIMMLLDDFKRDVGKFAPKKVKFGSDRATRDLLVGDNGRGGWYQRLRSHLEDESVWGAAGKMQRDLNAPWASLFDSKRAGGVFKEVLESNPTGAFGAAVETVSEKKLATLFREAANPDPLQRKLALKAQDAMYEWLSKGDDFVQAAGKHLDDVDPAALGEYKNLLDTTRTSLDKIQHAGDLGAKLEAMSGGASGAAQTGLGYVLGSLGVGGALPAALIGGVVDPARGIRQLAGIESLASKIGSKIGKAPKLSLGRSADYIPVAAAYTSMKAGDRRRLEASAEAAANSELSVIEAGARERGMAFQGAAPAVVEATVNSAIRIGAYAKEFAPKPKIREGMLGPGLPPTDHDLQVWERRRAVIDRPMVVIDQIKDGSITREAVHALDHCYPLQAERLRESYRAHVSEMSDKGQSLPQQSILALEMLLGVAVEGINSPSSVAAIQARYAETPEQTKQRRNPTKPALAEHMRDPLFGD